MSFWKDFFGFASAPAPETRSAQLTYAGVSGDESSLLRLMGLEGITAHVTPRAAMGIPTFFGCIRLISELIASQPYGPYRKLEGGGSESDKEHPLWMLWHLRPNPQMSSYEARRMMVVNLKVHGFAVARIVRKGNNQPESITPLPSAEVQVYQDEPTGAYFFKHRAKRGTGFYETVFSEDDAIFLKDLSLDASKRGSIVDWQRQTIKTNLLAGGFVERYYEKGAFISGIISSPLIDSPEKAAQYKTAIMNAIKGDEFGGLGIATVGADTTYTPITRSNTESQLLEFLEKSDEDICMFFGVTLNMIGKTNKASSWGSSVEQAFIMLTKTVLLPLARQIQEEVDYKCYRVDELKRGCYTKHNFNALLQGDHASRADYIRTMLGNGVYTIDEVRALEEMAPVANGLGSHHLVQGAQVRLEQLGTAPAAPVKQKNGIPINGHTLSEP